MYKYYIASTILLESTIRKNVHVSIIQPFMQRHLCLCTQELQHTEKLTKSAHSLLLMTCENYVSHMHELTLLYNLDFKWLK